MNNHKELRTANMNRQVMWDTGGVITLQWRCLELAGEVGEFCNVMKKRLRERLQVPGSRATTDDVADELADVVICTDLLAMGLNVYVSFEESDDRVGRPDLDVDERSVQLFSTCSHLIEVARDPVRASTALPDALVRQVYSQAYAIARAVGFDLRIAVANKFNATSRKMGLNEGYRVSGDIPESGVRGLNVYPK